MSVAFHLQPTHRSPQNPDLPLTVHSWPTGKLASQGDNARLPENADQGVKR